MKRHKSQGAEYVKNIKRSMMMWDDDGTAKLLWSPSWAIFISATGERREIYGLSFADAQAMCRIHGVPFFDQSHLGCVPKGRS